mgnify:CR=1 FL=1
MYNIYLLISLIGIIILTKKILYKPQQKEHFGNPISLLKKIGEGIVNFCINLIDILLVIADVFSWIALLPFIIMDLIMIFLTWLWPITMIKGVVESIFIFGKVIFLAIIDFVTHLLRIFFEKVFGLLKGGLWGIPHTPDQHHSHTKIVTGVKDQFGDHHHHGDPTSEKKWAVASSTKDMAELYRPLRCYKSITSSGYINMIATIICPPLGVFMSFGLSGWVKIIICSILSLIYYIPGLVYALLITSHLGLGRQITAKDCGGIPNYGIRIAGCTGIKDKKSCKEATIPGWRDKSGNTINACGFVSDPSDSNGGKCYNIIYPSGIHTLGNTARFEDEQVVKARAGLAAQIDTEYELAYDKKLGSLNEVAEEGDDIEYNPMMRVRPLRRWKDEKVKNLTDKIDIPEGPWKFIGNE